MVVTITHGGYIKRNPISLYRSQHRGGKGKVGMVDERRGFRRNLFIASPMTISCSSRMRERSTDEGS